MTTWLVVRHKIRDYTAWKKVFDESEDLRKEHGIRAGGIGKNLDKPGEIYVYLQVDNVDRAKAFINSTELKDFMKRGGVVDKPDITFLEELAEVRDLAGSSLSGSPSDI